MQGDGAELPKTQHAVQLVGPGQLALTTGKAVDEPGPHEVLVKVECVGLCYSDLKLMKQFSAHPRKGEIVSGISREVLDGCRSYVPGGRPGVPGHEVACRVVAVGERVEHHRVGERCLVQTDYRELATLGSNAAFGYNFEGGLQEYVLLDERVVVPRAAGERYLIPVPESLSASAVALLEPWSCVEDAYAHAWRRSLEPGGRLLVVAEPGHRIEGLDELLAQAGASVSMTAIVADEVQDAALGRSGIPVGRAAHPGELPDEAFDDIVCFGAEKATIELLNDKLAPSGLINVVLGGAKIGRPVSVGVGRIHYGGIGWIGTTGTSAADSYSVIPAHGELRAGDKILVAGAGGPMGQMHVIRSLCSAIGGLSVVASDVDDARLEALRRKAEPLSRRSGVPLRLVNPTSTPLEERFSYQVVLVPSGALVASAILASEEGGLINIFAGIPAPTRHELDLDTYIARRCYMFGTSGSVIADMKTMLAKVQSGQIDTDASVGAVSGMAGAIDALRAVEDQTLTGKVVVYPMLHDVGLVTLSELGDRFPTVASKLRAGQWCGEAERELLRVAAGSGEAAPPPATRPDLAEG